MTPRLEEVHESGLVSVIDSNAVRAIFTDEGVSLRPVTRSASDGVGQVRKKTEREDVYPLLGQDRKVSVGVRESF